MRWICVEWDEARTVECSRDDDDEVAASNNVEMLNIIATKSLERMQRRIFRSLTGSTCNFI